MRSVVRISPTAASRRLLALEFIRRYFGEYGASPSFGEIAAALNVPVQRVSAIVRDLEHRGDVMRAPGGRRCLRLPDTEDQLATSAVLAVLRRRGWVIHEDACRVVGPPTVSNPELTPARAHANDAGERQGWWDDGQAQRTADQQGR